MRPGSFAIYAMIMIVPGKLSHHHSGGGDKDQGVRPSHFSIEVSQRDRHNETIDN